MSAIHASDADVAEHVGAGRPTLIDFWAPWCGPCRQVSPVIDAIADEHPEFAVLKVDIDEAPRTTQEYGIRGVPTFAIVTGAGDLIELISGSTPKAQLVAALERASAR